MAEAPETDERFTRIWEAFSAQLSPGELPVDATVSLLHLQPTVVEAQQLLTTVQEPAADSGGVGPVTVDVGDLPSLGFEAGEGAAGPDLELRQSLGQGGMGQVLLAVQRSLRREVAVKTLKDDAADARNAHALLQEALFTGYLEHPNIVPVHLLGRDGGGRPVMVMKRVAGSSWRELMRDPAHPAWGDGRSQGERLARQLEILTAVSNALHFAHSKGVIHRDIKPDNVMLGNFGEVYLLDWGLALRLDRRDPRRDVIVGTPAFMAPEMLDGEGAVDERTDVYLLGACLHQILTGRPRHPGATTQLVLLSAFHSPPCEHPPDAPPELVDLCRRATARDPAARPPSALAFRQELEAFLRHRGSVQLAEEGDERLEELRQLLASARDEERPRLVGVFAECRFAYEQALRQWPENAPAQAGLQECLERVCDYELQRRNVGLVETLLARLPRPRPDLVARLEQAREQLRAEAASQARLRDLERELDVAVGSRTRGLTFLVCGLCCALLTLAGAEARRRGWWELSHADSMASLGLMSLVATAVFWVTRESLLATTISRRLVGVGYVMLLGPLLNHILAASAGFSVDQAQPVNALLVAVVFLCSAVMTAAWRGLIVSGVMVLGALLLAYALRAWPEWVMHIQALCVMVGFSGAASLSWCLEEDAAPALNTGR